MTLFCILLPQKFSNFLFSFEFLYCTHMKGVVKNIFSSQFFMGFFSLTFLFALKIFSSFPLQFEQFLLHNWRFQLSSTPCDRPLIIMIIMIIIIIIIIIIKIIKIIKIIIKIIKIIIIIIFNQGAHSPWQFSVGPFQLWHSLKPTLVTTPA